MWDLIIHKLIKDAANTGDPRVRERYGTLGGVAGIIVNFIIFLIEIFIGLVANSIAILADAFHNITDVLSSAITLISFRMSGKPADKEHPFGHGRIEYLSTLIVSFLIMLIGYEFIKSSVSRILHPSAIHFSLISLILILVAIPLKILLSLFYRHIGLMIRSSTLQATSFDALSDVFVLGAASVSLILSFFTRIPVDGYIGVVVAIFNMSAGFSLARKTFNTLIGEPPDPVLVRNIREGLLEYPPISGSHDLIIHSYGPNHYIASIHAEVPCDIPVVKLHEAIDLAEKELSEKLNVILVLHMDPLNKDDAGVKAADADLMQAIRDIKGIRSIHDQRIVGDGEKKHLI